MADKVGQVFEDYDGHQMMCIHYQPPSHDFTSEGYGQYEKQIKIEVPAYYDLVYLPTFQQARRSNISQLSQIENTYWTLDQVKQMLEQRQHDTQVEKQRKEVRDDISYWDQKIAEDRMMIKQIEGEIAVKERKRKELIEKLKSIQ